MNIRKRCFELDNQLTDIIIDLEKAATIHREIQEGYFPYSAVTEDNRYEFSSSYPHYGILTFILGDYLQRISSEIEDFKKELPSLWKGAAQDEPGNTNI